MNNDYDSIYDDKNSFYNYLKKIEFNNTINESNEFNNEVNESNEFNNEEKESHGNEEINREKNIELNNIQQEQIKKKKK